MRPDVTELARFYASPWGRFAAAALGRKLAALWGEGRGEARLAIGYPLPLLTEGDASTLVMMPEGQGGRSWPACGRNRVVLAREEELPFPDHSFDRVLLVHALECARRPNRLLREVWRVLAEGGRMVLVVPNRHGLWCWSERTPFGQGRPFTIGQIERLCRGHLFEPLRRDQALYLPPLGRRLGPRLAPVVERIGERTLAALGGVLLLEVEKRICAATPLLAGAPRGRRKMAEERPAVAAARSLGGREAVRGG